MPIRLLALAFGIPFLLVSSIPAQEAAAPRDLSELLEKMRSSQELPALTAVIVSSDGILAQGVAGVRRAGHDVAAEMTDRWHLGSCTKAMTATLTAVLVEKEKLGWDLTIASALPELAEEMHDELKVITIESLLANRGRIGDQSHFPELWQELYGPARSRTPREQRRLLAESLLKQEPAIPQGQYHYSNFGFAIAGHMLETLLESTWEELIREHVFASLGMNSAGFGVPGTPDEITQPWPHRGDGSTIAPIPLADNPPAIAPAGTVHASITDWSAFIRLHLAGAQGEESLLLKPKSFERLHRSHGAEGQPPYALGWLTLTRPWAKGPSEGDTGRVLTHNGTNNSWYATVWIAPEQDFAALAVTNIGGGNTQQKMDTVISGLIRNHLVSKRR
ncbi:MAG: serine hydrolase domain-containing protein [Planctomycetota bacterium]